MNRCAVLLVLAAAISSSGCATPLESVFIPDPGSGLKVGYSADHPGQGTIVEYVPAGEDIDHWVHLLTIEFIEGNRRGPEGFVAALEQEMQKRGGTLDWKVIEHDANSVLYEWRLLDNPKQGPLYQDQCELARLMRGNDGLHRVAWTERARTMDPANRERYLKAFRAAYVVKGENAAPVVLKP